MAAELESVERKKADPWEGLQSYIDHHAEMLIDKNLATKEMQFVDGNIIYDQQTYELSDLGWRSLCARMKPKTGTRKPPPDYIRQLPMSLQEQIMEHHFAEIPKTRHFMRAKIADDHTLTTRAFVSQTYQRGRFDYKDFVEIVISEFQQKMPGFIPVSYDVGERIFHIKTLSDAYITDPVQAKLRVGLMFSDSEVGAGCVVIRPFVRREGAGTDLFILSDSFKRRHTGARRQRDAGGKLMDLSTAVLQQGVDTDRLRISRDIKAHIDQLVTTHNASKTQAEAKILQYYETDLPIEDWSKESKLALFEWLWKRCKAVGLSKGTLKEAVEKLEDYDMKNLWGLFCAMCEVVQHPIKEQQLDDEIKASKVADYLYAILKR